MRPRHRLVQALEFDEALFKALEFDVQIGRETCNIQGVTRRQYSSDPYQASEDFRLLAFEAT